jgi:trigger factor
MNITVEKQPKCLATLRVEIPADRVRGERDRILSDYTQRARIPGFRPGKAPRPVVEKRYGREISANLEETLVREAFGEALKRENLRVLDFGSPLDLAATPEGGLAFTSKLTLAPEVTLPEYKGIRLRVPPITVREDEVQAEIETIREQAADYRNITDRPAATGDLAIIDYSSTVEGTPTDEFLGEEGGALSGRKGVPVRIDDKSFLPGFSANLVGMSPGDSKEFTVTMPGDFQVEQLRGRAMTFQTTVHGIMEVTLPETNDEFAAKVLPGATMEQLTNLIRSRIEAREQQRNHERKIDQIVEHFNRIADFELPDDLVAAETQNKADALVNRGVEMGMSEEDIAGRQDEIVSSAGRLALLQLRSDFILREIARQENITVSEEEISRHIARAAEARKMPVAKLVKDLRKSGRIPAIHNSLMTSKAIDFVISHAELVETAEETTAAPAPEA